MRIALGFLFLFTALVAAEPGAGLTGRILDPVGCQADPRQTYALYVPSGYVPTRKWPVIFCFDPGARGRVPVERLQAAAETHGYIVAGSLTSRNGPWADNAAAIQAMVRDVERHLSIDVRRIYAAGLSGGARVATQVAIGGLAKGVIACSAGFPPSEEGMPDSVEFAFFGTAGSEDFNRGELWRLDAELDDRKAPHRIVFFEGGHEWAPAALLTEAVEWLELQAMRTGARDKDAAFIAGQRERRLAALREGTGLARWRGLRALAADFKGLADVSAWETEAKALGRTPAIKAALKAESAAQRREDDLVAELGELAAEGSAAMMRTAVAGLRERAAAPGDSEDRRMARRVMAGFASSGREAARAMFAQGDFREATALLEILLEFRPGQSRTLYDLARARAGNGEKKEALRTLLEAAEAGFSDAQRVESESLFARVRGDPAYQTALKKIRENPPEPNGRGRMR